MSQSNVRIIDHKDSFTWNLSELIGCITGKRPDIVPHEELAKKGKPRKDDILILSPGPGIISDPCYHSSFHLLETISPEIRVLGVCLGHQMLGIHAGCELEQIPLPNHGMSTELYHDGKCPLWYNVPSPFQAGLYHSWQLSQRFIPSKIRITARDRDGNIQGIQYKDRPWFGIQFHPESILTPSGRQILSNLLRLN